MESASPKSDPWPAEHHAQDQRRNAGDRRRDGCPGESLEIGVKRNASGIGNVIMVACGSSSFVQLRLLT